MARTFRRFLARTLPSSVKSCVRRWWFRHSATAAPVPLSVQSDLISGRVCARVAHLPSIILTEAVLPDLRVHCESREHAGEMRAFVEACEAPGILVDVGAHNGFFSLLYAASNPSNKVLAFEPSDSLRARASDLAAINHLTQRIEFSHAVLADKVRSVEFFSDSASGFVQSRAFLGNEQSGFHPVTLHATSLDEACSERSLVPTLVKVDVEGYEWEVLQGARNILERRRPVLFLELHLNYLEQRGLDSRLIVNLLEGIGYHFFTAEGKRLSGSAVMRSWQSVVRFIARPAA